MMSTTSHDHESKNVSSIGTATKSDCNQGDATDKVGFIGTPSILVKSITI